MRVVRVDEDVGRFLLFAFLRFPMLGVGVNAFLFPWDYWWGIFILYTHGRLISFSFFLCR